MCDLVRKALGGSAPARLVPVLAAVLALNGADTAAVSATTSNLENAFGIGNTEIGLLLSVVAVAGAIGTPRGHAGSTSTRVPSSGSGGS